MQNLHNVDDHENGEFIICRRYINLNTGNHKFQFHFKYRIVKFEGACFTI
jgi:hypothetical protein